MVSFISFKVLHKPGLDRGSPILAQFQIEWSSGLADLLSCWSTALWIFEKKIYYILLDTVFPTILIRLLLMLNNKL